MICKRWTRFSWSLTAFAVALMLSGLTVFAQGSNPPEVAAPEQRQVLTAQPVAAQEPPKTPVTILEDTLIRVRTNAPINSKDAKNGTPVFFMVSEDVIAGGLLAIPRGAIVHGIVVKSKKAGRLTGRPELTFEMTSLDLGGRSYPLYTQPFDVRGASKTGPTEKKVIIGAGAGAALGAMTNATADMRGQIVVDPAPGYPIAPISHTSETEIVAATAGIGAGVGTAVSALSPGPSIRIPAESQLDFYLTAPITVMPVSAKEAARLSQGLRAGGPTLYLRGDNP